MIETSKQIILLVGLFTPSESFLDAIVDSISPLSECILPNSWTAWVEQGTCGEVIRKRTYRYFIREYEILQKKMGYKIFLKPTCPAVRVVQSGSWTTRLEMKQIKFKNHLVVSKNLL